MPPARNRSFHEFRRSKPHAVPGMGAGFSRYEQTLPESSASVTLMIKPASALKSARSSAPTTAICRRLSGLSGLKLGYWKKVSAPGGRSGAPADRSFARLRAKSR